MRGDGGSINADDIGATIETVAGAAYGGHYSGDGGPAIEAKLNRPGGVAVGQDGSLYIADTFNNRIRRVSPDGIITTIAVATNVFGNSESANESKLYLPDKIAIGHDGSLYISYYSDNRVSRVSLDGIITTVAGTSKYGYSGDGGLAIEAKLTSPNDVAVGQDGSLYITDHNNYRIRRVSPDGIITTIAGAGEFSSSGDGGAATQANINYPVSLTIEQDGSIYFSEILGKIRRISPDGMISAVAGIEYPKASITVGQTGSLYITETFSHRIRKVYSGFFLFSVDTLTIASKDGQELYLFNTKGRHLRTINAITGSLIYEFGYNDKGDLTSIKDEDNNTTIIERSGNQISIIAPHGQKISLTLNTEGYLESVKNPANETINLTYYDGGLLKSLTDAKQQAHLYQYDEEGRLRYDENPSGGSWTLERTELADGYQVTKSSKLGRTTTYNIDNSIFDKQTSVVSYPDGTKKETIRNIDSGDKKVVLSDGTILTTQDGFDPRFGAQAAFTKESVIKTPQNLEKKVTRERTVELNDKNDLLSLKTLNSKTTINDRIYQSNYDAATRTNTTTSPENRVSKTIIDEKGRLSREETPGLAPTAYQYDNEGRLQTITTGEGEIARTTEIKYNPEGFVKSITNAENQITSFNQYDPIGRLEQLQLPDNRTISYDYDDNGNTIAITPPQKLNHEFDHTPLDYVKTYLPPEADNTDINNTHYQYNKDKQLELIQRPDGKETDLVYDNKTGQLKEIITPLGSINYQYNPDTGQVSTITTPDGEQLSYQFDGSLKTSETWKGVINGSVEPAYNNDFRIKSLTVNGTLIDYQYDDDGLLTQAADLSLRHDPDNGMLSGSDIGRLSDLWQYNTFGETKSYTVAYNNQWGQTRLIIINGVRLD